MNILQQNVSKGTQEASLATLITAAHGSHISRPAFCQNIPHICKHFLKLLNAVNKKAGCDNEKRSFEGRNMAPKKN